MENDQDPISFHTTLKFNPRKKNTEFCFPINYSRNRSYSTKEKFPKLLKPKPKPKKSDVCPSPISLTESEENSNEKIIKKNEMLLNPELVSKKNCFKVSDIPEEINETEVNSDGEEYSSKIYSLEISDGSDSFIDENEVELKINEKEKEPFVNEGKAIKDFKFRKTREKMFKIKTLSNKGRKSSDDLKSFPGSTKRKKNLEDYKNKCAERYINNIRNKSMSIFISNFDNNNLNSSSINNNIFEEIKHKTISFNSNKKSFTSILGYLEQNKLGNE